MSRPLQDSHLKLIRPKPGLPDRPNLPLVEVRKWCYEKTNACLLVDARIEEAKKIEEYVLRAEWAGTPPVDQP